MTTKTVENKHGVKVGDYFYCAWGFDQTNVDFYKVVRVTASKAEILPVAGRSVNDHGYSNDVVPSDQPREYDVLIGVNRGDAKRTKLCTTKAGYQGRPTIVLKSGEHWAWPHEAGSTHSETASGWGH